VKTIAFLALVAIACAPKSPPDREVRLGRLEAEHRALMGQLDDLQARLLVDSERVRFWEEMKGRHESVSAISCASQDSHAKEMAEHLMPEPQRAGAATKVRARVASVRAAPTPPAARRR
jgi:hypothetical protein